MYIPFLPTILWLGFLINKGRVNILTILNLPNHEYLHMYLGHVISSHLQYAFFFSDLSLIRGNISISCLDYSTDFHQKSLELSSQKCNADQIMLLLRTSHWLWQANSLCFQGSLLLQTFSQHLLLTFFYCPICCSFAVPVILHYALFMPLSILYSPLCICKGRHRFIYLQGVDQWPCTQIELQQCLLNDLVPALILQI